MKKIFLIAACILLIANSCYAHPPQSIKVSLNGKLVQIAVGHVARSKNHYIYKIETWVNGEQISWQNLFTQDNDVIKASYFIPSLKAGDVLEVKATCNIFGDKTTKIIVGQVPGDKKA